MIEALQTKHTSNGNELTLLRDEERQVCEVWTRVMGYHRPVSSFNVGKRGEFFERQYFEESSCDLSQ